MTHALILLSGGTGSRFGRELPKQYLSLKGKPIVLYSFLTFLHHSAFSNFVVVAEEEWHPLFQEFFDKEKWGDQTLTFALPGKRRQDSLLSGFQALPFFDGLVAIHDGARPFIDSSLIDRTIEGAKKSGAAAPARTIPFTLKEVDQEELVVRTLDRTPLREIQTPQILSYHLLKAGLNDLEDVTDDLSLVEKFGVRPMLVPGGRFNLKITYPEDMEWAEWIAGRIY